MRVARSSPRSLSLAPPRPRLGRFLCAPASVACVARCPSPPRRHLLLPPSPLGCVHSQALDVAAASPGVRPAVACCSPRALSAACAHKLSFLRRRRTVRRRQPRRHLLLLPSPLGCVRSQALVFAATSPGVRVGCAPACASSRVAASPVVSHPPVTACCHLYNKKFAHERRYERTRTLHRTNNRTGEGSGELLRAMFHNHCHASNRRIHQAPVCDKCQIARF